MHLDQPVVFQKIESAAVFISILIAWNHYDFNWLAFVALLFSFDIFMLGYFVNNRLGALLYNLGHSYSLPAILIALTIVTDHRLILGLALLWAAHIAWDRMFGYGLKFATGFKHTHLGNLQK